MKKLIYILFVFGFASTLVACGEEYVPQESSTEPSTEVAEDYIENDEELSLEELGQVIVQAGNFWTEWHTLQGRFDQDHIDYNERIGDDFSRLLPESGFESIDDIRNYLLQYYTENWAGIEGHWQSRNWESVSGFMFTEHFDILYINTPRQGSWEVWETAEHTLIEQDGSHAVVETVVWSQYSTGDDLSPAIYRFTFEGDRIARTEIMTNEPTGEEADETNFQIEDIGAIIVAVGTFWEDWWSMNGRFAIEHIDFYEQIGERMHRLLPESGFETLGDIRQYLLQYHTENWLDKEMADEFFPFAEYFDILYLNTMRAGFIRPNWESAEHVLIEQDGNTIIVETTVFVGAWHRTDLDPWEFAHESVYRFTFINGRIDHVNRHMHFYEPVVLD